VPEADNRFVSPVGVLPRRCPLHGDGMPNALIDGDFSLVT
jgi:hypothetical protein